MKFKNITLATAAAASLLLAAPNATAQERGTETRPEAQRPVTKGPAEVEATRRGADVAGPAAEDAAKVDRATAMAAAKKAETKHRENLAKISRLRDIFTERKATEQLRKLDGAEERENARYAKVVETARTRMGADVATCPGAVIRQMMKHPLSEFGLERFLADHRKLSG